MSQILETSVQSWSVPLRTSLSTSFYGSSIEVTSKDNKHFYATYDRTDSDFSNRPDQSSFEFEPSGAVKVAIDFAMSGAIEAVFMVIEYTDQSHESFRYKTPNFTHRVGQNVDRLTLAIRLKGEGRVVLGRVTTEAHRPIRNWERSVAVRSAKSVTVAVEAYALSEISPQAALLVDRKSVV